MITVLHSSHWLDSKSMPHTCPILGQILHSIVFYSILFYCVVLNCIVLLIYCYVDMTQYNAMHKFVRVLDNPRGLYKTRNLPCKWYRSLFRRELTLPRRKIFPRSSESSSNSTIAMTTNTKTSHK